MLAAPELPRPFHTRSTLPRHSFPTIAGFRVHLREADKLRKIVLGCDLTEEMKWGKPCFTHQKKDVAR
jgi:uncharacterized protein YdeI (YjbR/CyaY-like superfamily)